MSVTCIEHIWEKQPELSTNSIDRFQCAVCKQWAFRLWPPGKEKKLQPIQIYKNGFNAEKYLEKVAQGDHERARNMAVRDKQLMDKWRNDWNGRG